MNNSGSGRVMLSGSADAPLQNLKIFGKSVQNGTPSPENPVPIVSLGRPVPGKNLCPYGTKNIYRSPGTYTFSATVTSTDEKHDVCQVILANTTKADDKIIETGFIGRNNRSSVTFTISEPFNSVYLYAGYDYPNSEGETATFKDTQLELGSAATTYEPYRVVDQKMAITVSGKNLANVFNIKGQYLPGYNIIRVNEDGSIYVYYDDPLNSACSANITLKELCPGITPGTYTLTANTTGNRNHIYIGNVKKYWIFGSTLTLEEADLNENIFFYASDEIYSEALITNFQIELGSTATQYMPYKDPQVLEFSIPVYGRINLCPIGEATFETSTQINFDTPLEAGTYVLAANITSTDTDSNANLALFYYQDGSTQEVYITRNAEGRRVSKSFTLAKQATHMRIYASEEDTLSSGDTSTWSDIQVEAGSTATIFEPYFEPYGLPGIPVTTGGNYTDENGQQWFCDEIDFKKGVYIQRVGRFAFPKEIIFTQSGSVGDMADNYFWNASISGDVNILPFLPYAEEQLSLLNFIPKNLVSVKQSTNSIYTTAYLMRGIFSTAEELSLFIQDKATEKDYLVIYYRIEPIEYPLPESLIEAWNSISTYYPDTIIENNAGAFMWAQYLTNDDLPEDGLYTYPKTEVGQYYKALARYTLDYPEATCRECQLIRHLLDDIYELPFEVNDDSSRTEKYLWDLISNTKTMLSNIPKSDTEKFLHMMLGGEVTDYPTIDCERNFWMARCVEQALLTMALMNGGRA